MRSALALIVLLVATPLLPASGQAPLPEGCIAIDEGATCQWSFDTREDPADLVREFDIPVFARMHATVLVVHDGADGGWDITLYHDDEEAFEEHRHTPRSRAATVTRTTFQSIYLGEEDDAGLLRMTLLQDGVGIDGGASFTGPGLGPPSAGAFTVSYRAERLGAGIPPPRPAATRDDPHLLGAPLDARTGAHDLLAAWFDDAAEGDGLLEAHAAVRDLEDWGWREGGVAHVTRLDFEVLGVSYRLSWELVAQRQAASFEEIDRGCQLLLMPGGEAILTTACRADPETGELTAIIPETSVGSPGDGALFTKMSATTLSRRQDENLGYTTALDVEEDRVAGERYPFALGGAAVWDQLNPRLAVPPPVLPPWYQAPLHRENVPDTLQVAGALLAAATFLFGVIAVRRHRKQTRELLARIDALTRAHEREARQGLLALGEFEAEVTRLYQEGRLSDAQYQLLTQRVSASAARLALRHGLGLDDGTPGEGPTRRVPVEGPATRKAP